MYNVFNIFKHLLPRSKSWQLTIDKQLRQFFTALSVNMQDVIDFTDNLWLDMFPQHTRQIAQWEQQFGTIAYTQLTTQQRRDRLSGLWSATGGQSPRYIQDVLQTSGFNVFVYDWWVSAPPPVPRNPYTALGSYLYGAEDPQMQAGEPEALAGNGAVQNGYWLVNKLYDVEMEYTCLAGELLMESGEITAQAGENNGIVFDRIDYQMPNHEPYWHYAMYVGGSPFGTVANIPVDRWEEFEDLLLKICPAHLWIGVIASPLLYIYEDTTLKDVVSDGTTDKLIER